VALVLVTAGLVAGCGGDDELTVSAAASLSGALDAYGDSIPGEERFSFAGSGQLAAQIRQGAGPDLFASANVGYPEQLAAEGLAERPVVFARNQLVLVARPEAGIEALEDLAEPGVELVIGAEAVPVGEYTRELLARLPAGRRAAIVANVRSEESDVKGVVAKVAQGAADAGFVYSSDAAAAAHDLRVIELPRRLRPRVAYAIAVLSDTEHPERARRFVAGLLEGPGRQALLEAGLLPASGDR
jgi:molybdate transport system substrate-binding protein